MIDWQRVEDGLRDWVMLMTGIERHLIAWDREVVDFRKYVQIDLRLFDHRARENSDTSVIYPDSGTAPIRPVVHAERAVSWSITVTTRDQRANAKAAVVLDQLALLLDLPYSLETFAGFDMSIIGPAGVITSTNVPSEHRELSQATLRVELAYVLCVEAPATALPAAAVSVIEHAD